jgi:hypothetical protein
MRRFPISLAAVLGLASCAPKALYFHESTKVAFAATYNTSDSQPLSTSFGFKRRIIAVVPAQKRHVAKGGTESTATNHGEALSIVSKFHVSTGTSDGISITNNFASGMAARAMTRSAGSADAVSVLMHSAPIRVDTSTGMTESGKSAADVVNARLKAIMGKRTRPSDVPASSATIAPDANGNLRPPDAGGKKDGAAQGALPKKTDVPGSESDLLIGPNGEVTFKKR